MSKKILKEIDENLIGLNSSQLMKLLHQAKVKKDAEEAAKIEEEFKRRDIQVVNKSLHEVSGIK